MKPDGVGAQGLAYWEARQAVAANNLANISTPGFKGERVFARLLDDASLDIASATDFTSGAVDPTGRPLDLAIVGEGFLVVDAPGGERWIRGGSLSLDGEGVLVDPAGNPVLGVGGSLMLPPGVVEIDHRGQIFVDGAATGQLRLERPGRDEKLEREGANMWMPSGSRELIPRMDIDVRQSHLERSNVNAITSMVDMIQIQQAYASIQKVLGANDDAMQTITTEISRIG